MVITDTVSRLDDVQTRITLEPHGEIDAGSIDELSTMVQGALRAGHLCLRNPAPEVRRLLRLTAFCPGPAE